MAVILIVEEDTAISTQIEKIIYNIANGNKILKSREGKRVLEIALYNKDLNTISLKYADIGIQIGKTYKRVVNALL